MRIYVNGVGMGTATLGKSLDRYEMRGKVTPEQVVEASRFYDFDKDGYLNQRELNGSVARAKAVLSQEYSPSVLESVKKKVFDSSSVEFSDFAILAKAHNVNDDSHANRYELEMAATSLKRGNGTAGFTYKGRSVESDRGGWKVDGKEVGVMRFETGFNVGSRRSFAGISTEALGRDRIFKSEEQAVRGLIDAGVV